MATRIEAFEVTVPAGTAQATPADTDLTMIPGQVETLQVMIPPGPSGLVGFAFVLSSQQVIPFAAGSYIVADNEVITWDLDRFPEVGTWTFRAYNTDIYDHVLYIRMSMLDSPADVPPARISGFQEQFIPPGGGDAEIEDVELPALELIGPPVEDET